MNAPRSFAGYGSTAMGLAKNQQGEDAAVHEPAPTGRAQLVKKNVFTLPKYQHRLALAKRISETPAFRKYAEIAAAKGLQLSTQVSMGDGADFLKFSLSARGVGEPLGKVDGAQMWAAKASDPTYESLGAVRKALMSANEPAVTASPIDSTRYLADTQAQWGEKLNVFKGAAWAELQSMAFSEIRNMALQKSPSMECAVLALMYGDAMRLCYGFVPRELIVRGPDEQAGLAKFLKAGDERFFTTFDDIDTARAWAKSGAGNRADFSVEGAGPRVIAYFGPAIPAQPKPWTVQETMQRDDRGEVIGVTKKPVGAP